MQRVKDYVDEVTGGVNLPREDLDLIREELESHLSDTVSEGLEKGLDSETAAERAVAAMGDPESLRGRYLDAYLKQHLTGVAIRLGGLAVTAFVLCWAVLLRSPFQVFWNPEAFLLVPVGASILLCGAFGPVRALRAFAAPFRIASGMRDGGTTGLAEVLRAYAVFLGGTGLLAALLGTMGTLVAVDPSSMGPPLALALLGTGYGALGSGIAWTLAHNLPVYPGSAAPSAPSGRVRLVMASLFLVTTGIAAGRVTPLPGLLATCFHLPTAGFVILAAGGLSLAAFGPVRLAGTLAGIFSNRSDPSGERARRLRAMAVHLGVTGLLGIMLGGVMLLVELSDPATLKTGIALTLVSGVHGLVPAMLLLMAARGKEKPHPREVGWGVGERRAKPVIARP